MKRRRRLGGVLVHLVLIIGALFWLAPLLLALGCQGLTNIKEQGAVWLLRLILMVPAAALLYQVFFALGG